MFLLLLCLMLSHRIARIHLLLLLMSMYAHVLMLVMN